MGIVVQKYGGTSVENKEKLEMVCNRIISYVNRKEKVVVVVSAQGKTTDSLIKKAKEYVKAPTKRELDLLLSTGELQTVAILSMMLNERGYSSIGLTGEQAGILSDSTYGNASIKTIYTKNILNHLNEGKIVIVAGFQAIDKIGNITTLGRGGSDLTAVAIASAIKAKSCEIYSDIDGIFSADPRIIKKAKLIKKISYDEMLEAASAGAKVLHNRSVNMGKKNKMPIIVRNAGSRKRGSVVSNELKTDFPLLIDEKNECMENYKVKFITKKDNISKISIIGDMITSNKEAIIKLYNLAYKEHVTIYMISFCELSINIIIDSEKAQDFMEKLHKELIED